MILNVLATILATVLRILSVYFFIVALFCLKKPKRFEIVKPQTRFACLIAARNEERVIGQLVESLKNQDYPDELYDIYVVLNNCTDDTEERARRAGAEILACQSPVRYKGDALHEAVERLGQAGYDAYCFFDADNIADKHFLARMNDAFCGGARVGKATFKVKNPKDSWVSGCYGLYLTLFDTFYSRARANCGLSAKLVGTGFAVRRDVFEQLGGWNTVTIAEDAEFSAQCAAAGIRVHFVFDAVTYDEAPAAFSVSMRQRRRWVSGVMSVTWVRMRSLLSALKERHGMRAFDMLAFLLAPYGQALSPLPLLLFAAAAALGGSLKEFALLFGGGLLALWIGLTLFGLLLAKLGGYSLRMMAKSILTFPVFMVSWLPLQILSLFRRTTEWKVIGHSGNASANELTH